MSVSQGAAFPPPARLRRKAEFDAVFADARSVANPYFRLLARPNGVGHARLGMIVSRRVDRRAVVRNRIKRAVRESFRKRRASLAGWDFVILAKGQAAVAGRGGLGDAIESLWERFLGRYHRPAQRESG